MNNFRPQSYLIIGNVPWDNSYNHVVNFKNASEQREIISAHMLSRNHVRLLDFNIIRPEYDLIVEGNFERYRNYGYVMFTNPDLLNGVTLYAFIKDVKFQSVNSTRIVLEMDEWQNHHLTLSLKPSFVKRMHIPKSQDTVGRWLASEPFNLKGDVYRTIDSFSNADFTPKFIVNTLSYPNPDAQADWDKYIYGGWGATSEEMTMIFGRVVESSSQILDFIYGFVPKNFSPLSGDIDHRSDIISISAIPGCIFNDLLDQSSIIPAANYGYNVISNSVGSKVKLFNLSNTLACGYTPKNKKLLTSLCKSYSLFNFNGFQKFFKPELFNDVNAPSAVVEVSMRPINCSSISCKIYGYGLEESATSDMSIPLTSNFLIPYNVNLVVGFNENSGAVRASNQFSAISKTIAGAGSTLAIGGLNPVAAAGVAMTSLYEGVRDIANSNAEYTGQIGGNSSDTLSVKAEWIKLRWSEISPKYDECKQVDDYLSAYGYEIDEVIQPSITNRSAWNYCEIENPALSVNAPAPIRSLFASWFERGITVWHDIDNMNNYNQNND